MTQSPKHLEINWDVILETIRAEKCILFLGPELFMDEKGHSLNRQLLQFLDVANQPDVKVYKDGLFYFRELSQKTLTYYRIKSFFRQDFPRADALFRKIARIPFHFIVSITPDTRLSQAFDKEGIKHDFSFYWKNHTADNKARVPTRDSPLIFNFFGSMEKQESMVLTHDDLFDFFESIFQGKSLSPKLKHHLMKEADNFVFLGMQFDKWYMQLLLRFLHLHKDQDFIKYAFNRELDEDIITLCYDHFRINFVPNNIEFFIDEIYQRCEEADMLRRPGEEKPSVVDKFKQWVASDDIERVFLEFLPHIDNLGEEGVELYDNATLLQNRFHRLQKRMGQGIIGEQDASVESNKIRKSLMDLLNEARNLI